MVFFNVWSMKEKAIKDGLNGGGGGFSRLVEVVERQPCGEKA